MLYALLADFVLIVHLAFVAFVALGGVVVMRWPRLAVGHVPAAAWGVLVEFTGSTCPLTPLEVAWRQRGGEAGYAGGFIEHYVTAIVYPAGLTRGLQIALGCVALGVNAAVYCVLIARRRRRALAG